MGQTQTRSHTLSWRWMAKFLDFCTFATRWQSHVDFVRLWPCRIAEYLLYASVMKTTTATTVAAEKPAPLAIWREQRCEWTNERASKWRKKKEVPSAKMKIRIFYLLQDCYEYKFMFEYNIKMYNSHLIVRVATYTEHAPTQPSRTEREMTKKNNNNSKTWILSLFRSSTASTSECTYMKR